MLDDSNLNKTVGKYRTAEESHQTIDNCAVHNNYQLVKLFRKNALTYLHENTLNKFIKQGKLKISVFIWSYIIITKQKNNNEYNRHYNSLNW